MIRCLIETGNRIVLVRTFGSFGVSTWPPSVSVVLAAFELSDRFS
jgi:hypothetical protein